MLLKVAITSTINEVNIIWCITFQFLSETRLGSNSGETYKNKTETIVVIHPKNDNWNTLFSSVYKLKLKGSKYIKNRATNNPDNTGIIKFLKPGLGAGYFWKSIFNIEFFNLKLTHYTENKPLVYRSLFPNNRRFFWLLYFSA